jgi:DNA-binding protein HU-beta
MKVQDFYGALAKKAGTTKAQAIEFVRALEEVLTEEVRDKGETIPLGKVGKFVLKDAPARTMRNPFTGQDMETRAYRTIQFKTAYAMRADAETAKKGKK